jgi:hypothetical protein
MLEYADRPRPPQSGNRSIDVAFSQTPPHVPKKALDVHVRAVKMGDGRPRGGIGIRAGQPFDDSWTATAVADSDGGTGMVERVTYHVVPGEHGWNVEQENTGKVVSNHRTRTEAILQGRDFAIKEEYSLLVVHDRNGQVEKQYNYGRIPRRSPEGQAEEQSQVNP